MIMMSLIFFLFNAIELSKKMYKEGVKGGQTGKNKKSTLLDIF